MSGANLEVVTSAQQVRTAANLLDRPERLQLAFVMATLVARLAPEGQGQPELYALTTELMAALEGDYPVPVLELAFKLRLLDLLGYSPELDHCVICRQQSPELEYHLSAERGGLVCSDCGLGTTTTLSQKAIKLWRLSLQLPLERLAEIAEAPALASSTLGLADDFYTYHFGSKS